MNVAILAIGNEVLCGKITNTNSTFMAREIERIGGTVVYQQVVCDDESQIAKGLKQAYTYADHVITIGGLGPTVDDLSRQGVAKYFNETLVIDEETYKGIKAYFDKISRSMPDNNMRQAYVFASGTIIPNPNGTAPGLALHKNKQTVFLLPGPPNELEPMFNDYVLPYIKERVGDGQISRSYRLYGIGESFAEARIIGLYDKYPRLNIAPYCSITYTDYVVTTCLTNEDQLNAFEEDFLALMKNYHIGNQMTQLGEEVIALFKEKKLTLSTAESCTGGLIASELVNVAGASEVFLEGFVTYSNEAKTKRLGVDTQLLVEHGAVSEAVARAMSEGLKLTTKTDVAIGITGIAGPGGGTEMKPVGLTYISITTKNETVVKRYIFYGNREKIRQRAMTQALFLLYHNIKAF